MEHLVIIFGIMAIFYVAYLFGRVYFMTMPITVSDEECTKIVAMIDRSIRRYGLEQLTKEEAVKTVMGGQH